MFGFTIGDGSFAHFAEGGSVVPSLWVLALIPVMFSYSGWNAATYVAEEIRETGRNVPLALGLAVLEMGGEERVALFRQPPEGRPDPDRAVRQAYWKMYGFQGRYLAKANYRQRATESWIETLEGALAAAGVPLPDEGHLRGWRRMSDADLMEAAAKGMED